jgi:hypothetical protein
MKRQSSLQIAPVTALITLLTLVVVSACAVPSSPPAATPIPPSAEAATPTSEPPATATVPTEPPATATPVVATLVPTEPPATATPLVPTEPPATSAQYQLTFEATWSAETHPVDFPPGPHFSGLIGASHGPEVGLWEEGELATPGIQNMAETGSKSPLGSEIDSLISDGSACAKISGGGVNPSPGAVTVTFTVNQDCPLVSVVSMIAPSPDWFVGVSGLSLYEDGEWVEQRVVELFPYDAGTDSGSGYTSPDEPTVSPEAIYDTVGQSYDNCCLTAVKMTK